MMAAAAVLIGMSAAIGQSLTVKMYHVAAKGHGVKAGTVVFKNTRYGLLIEPHLYGLRAGLHGFHVHLKPDCSQKGMAANGHFDPKKTGKHLGPYNDEGHLGDLPALYVNEEGMANLPVIAPRLKIADLYNHALMIHGGGDNYSDDPKILGGGGARMVCGVVEHAERKS